MEVISKEGKELETILEEICEENNITKNDFYYHYTETKNGLFNKNTIIKVEAMLKSELVNYVKDFLE